MEALRAASPTELGGLYRADQMAGLLPPNSWEDMLEGRQQFVTPELSRTIDEYAKLHPRIANQVRAANGGSLVSSEETLRQLLHEFSQQTDMTNWSTKKQFEDFQRVWTFGLLSLGVRLEDGQEWSADIITQYAQIWLLWRVSLPFVG